MSASTPQPRAVRSVWKFPIPIGFEPPVATVEMPIGARILRIGQQQDQPMVWALVDPDQQEREVRHLIAVPTGFPIPIAVDYLGTTEIHDGQIVVHVFEVSS